MKGTVLYSENGFKETFTSAHRDKMKFEYVLHGFPSALYLNGENLFHLTFAERIKHFLKRKLQGKSFVPLEFFFKKYKPKVIVVEYVNSAAKIVDIAEKYNVKIVVNAYGYDVFRNNIFQSLKPEYLRLFKIAEVFSVQSISIKQKLIELGCDERKILVNTSAPSSDLVLASCDYLSNNFIAAGRFVDKKAPYLTILAFNEVVKKYDRAKLVFIGDGILLEACRHLVKALGLERNVEFKGAVSHEVLLSEYQKSFCFLQHSLEVESGDSEGLPVAMIEAHSYGLPIISTLHSGIPECVIDGETGFLVEENDVMAMSSKMIQLWEDRRLAEKMGMNGKQFVKNSFSEEMHLSKLTEIINKVLSLT